MLTEKQKELIQAYQNETAPENWEDLMVENGLCPWCVENGFADNPSRLITYEERFGVTITKCAEGCDFEQQSSEYSPVDERDVEPFSYCDF